MAKKPARKRNIEQYDHKDKKRVNNPPVGLVTPDTDKDTGTKQQYKYDPHLDPQLVWAGKAEHTSFVVPTRSLHVHERIDPRTIIEAVRKRNGQQQPGLFDALDENLPLREAVEFYKHAHNWSNRLVAGDSLLVMNSLLEKEGLSGKVQMVYIDPPYGIKYGSNFQPFVNKRDVKDGRDEDLTAEPEMIKAFRDTWELGIHSYLTYLRDRLLLAKDLLNESGSCFVQISDENVHLVRNLMDEVFDTKNFVALIPFRKKTMPLGAKYLERMFDFIIWYSKRPQELKYRQLYQEQDIQGDFHWGWIELHDGRRRKMTIEEVNNHSLLPKGCRIFRLVPLWPASFSQNTVYPINLSGKEYWPPKGLCWVTGPEGIRRLMERNRIQPEGEGNLRYIYFYDDYPLKKLVSIWDDTVGAREQLYVVQTAEKVIQRCMLMTTDPGDLVFDPTCGSGFKYKTVPHITLKSIANNEPPGDETLYDQPSIDNSRARVTGPFTVEAVPAPMVKPIDDIEEQSVADTSIVRSGETKRQDEWRSELLKSGIRGKGGQKIEFSRVEPIGGTRSLQAEAETKEDKPQRVVISFGPEHAPLEQRQVEQAIDEAEHLKPTPKIIVFAAFQFDPEAAKDIDETDWPGVTLLKVQMNSDLLTEDLKKKRSSNESFWLIGQPDIILEKIKQGEHKGKFQVTVKGFDYYNTRTGILDSGGTDKIAMWMLDTDYDGRSLYPRQVFFPMAGENEGWTKLAKNLKAEIDPDLIKAYIGTASLPFEAGENKKIAVKIIDDRGIESLRILGID